MDNVRSSVIEDASWALVKEGLSGEVWAGMCSLGEGEQVYWALISREMQVDYLVSKMLPWSLMGWKPSTRGVGLGMVSRRGMAIGIRFSKMGIVRQSYLGFRMLAWPLVE